MKKYLSLFLVMALLLSSVSCAAKSEAPLTTDIKEPTESPTSETPASYTAPEVAESDEDAPVLGGGWEVPQASSKASDSIGGVEKGEPSTHYYIPDDGYEPSTDNETYDPSKETSFLKVGEQPLSTFSADVDTASYSNLRRQINNYQAPQGVRIEELVNYFNYSYPNPKVKGEVPFSITTEVAKAPWNPDHQLVMIGIQGEELKGTRDIENNLVFLIDVSGSMVDNNKLPLLKEALLLMIENLNEKDRVSIITYSGEEKIIADSIPGNNQRDLRKAINKLKAGGATAGKRAMVTAYELAEKNFIEEGNNRIILCTDGDYNVGDSSVGSITDFVAEKRETGVYISVLGFGMYNLKDYMMESIADNGNGNYHYIDTLEEGKKVLVDEFDSLMYPIAKDVKIQVEFNPNIVKEYRLIGYDNRRLENKDFEDDTKDAGEMGSGHSVTAFYEIVPLGAEETVESTLEYQKTIPSISKDYLNVKVRYKPIDSDTSLLVEQSVGKKQYSETPSTDFMFASSVVEFGLIVTDSEYKGASDLGRVKERAQSGANKDPLRKEFVTLVETYESNLG